MTKQALLKPIEKIQLRWKELESSLLDIEITFNNRLLGYIEDDIYTTIHKPKLMILGQPNFGLEVDAYNIED